MTAADRPRLADIEAAVARVVPENRTTCTQDRAVLVEALRAVLTLHFAYPIYEPCSQPATGCDDESCTESPHDGMWFHSDQPVGRACGECHEEDGDLTDWPCPTLRAIEAHIDTTNPSPRKDTP